MLRQVTVAREAAVGLGSSKRVFVGDRRIAVFNDEGTLRAVDDVCTHVGGRFRRGFARTVS